MDLRILIVAAPVLIAVSWAAYNIGRAALGQLQIAVKQFKANQVS